jgi:hypothetical protein
MPTVPPVCGSVILLPYPLPAASDTWKPVGAVTVIFPVKLLPETVNCWILGLMDALPAQAEMAPVGDPDVMEGGAGFTVIVNVTGAPAQFAVFEIKLSVIEVGFKPTLTVATTELVVVFITDTVPEPIFATNTRSPLKVIDTPAGLSPTGIVVVTRLELVLITETLFESWLET